MYFTTVLSHLVFAALKHLCRHTSTVGASTPLVQQQYISMEKGNYHSIRDRFVQTTIYQLLNKY